METTKWLHRVIDAGLLCGNYKTMALEAKSKIALMDIVLDSNGASYLCEMQAKGFPLSYETILDEFKAYINGKYIAEYKNEKGNGYTSCVYCCYYESDEIHIHTTNTTILGCKAKIYVKPYDFVQIHADKNCELEIFCPETSRIKIDYWDGAIIEVNNSDYCGRVDMIKHT